MPKLDTHGYYLFLIYDSTDESKMRVIKRHKDGAQDARELNEIANNLLQTTEGAAWLEIYKLCGRRIK